MNYRQTFTGVLKKLSCVLAFSGVLISPLDAARADVYSPRVLNGAPSTDNVPWVVSLQTYNDFGTVTHICGGTLISPDTVLTAAHCVIQYVNTPEDVEVLVGTSKLSSGGERIMAIGMIVHPNYDDIGYRNDIALVKLEYPANVSTFPSLISDGELSAMWSSPVRLYGWGVKFSDIPVRPDQLQQVDIPLIDDPQCEERLGLDFDRSTMLCAGKLASSTVSDDGVDACEGDSGGPLVSTVNGQPRVVGIVSWGFACGSSKVYGVYTRTASFLPWVTSSPGVPPFLRSSVEIRGTPIEGQTLTCQSGDWGGEMPQTQTYQWIDRDEGPLPGRTTQKIRLTKKDVGRILQCSVTVQNSGGGMEAVSEETSTILPRQGTSKSAGISAVRTQCTKNQCIALFSARERIVQARAIVTNGSGKARLMTSRLATNTAVAVQYKRGSVGTLVLRVVFKSGRSTVKEIRLGLEGL